MVSGGVATQKQRGKVLGNKNRAGKVKTAPKRPKTTKLLFQGSTILLKRIRISSKFGCSVLQ